MILRAVIWLPSYSEVEASASVAYLAGVCFPKECDEKRNASTLGLFTQAEASFIEPMECLSVSKLPEGVRWKPERAPVPVAICLLHFFVSEALCRGRGAKIPVRFNRLFWRGKVTGA